MKFYMVRDKATGMWYKKGGIWVVQEFASVWTTPNGPVGAKSKIARDDAKAKRSRLTCASWKPREPETVIFTAVIETPSRVVLVKADDWEGIYFDGKLVEEGHNLRLEDVLARLDIVAKIVWANDEWLSKLGRLPENLEEVQ